MAGGINSRKPQAAAASASGGAIGDNSSTLEDAVAGMVDRLSQSIGTRRDRGRWDKQPKTASRRR